MTISIRLTPDEEARLERLSQRTGRSKTLYIRAALQEHLASLEDAFAVDEAFEKLESNGRTTRPLAELKAETNQ
ncbi:MAG TPA: DUF6290 family protein [Glaciihabitans sp.]|jgi:RHH-type rel operon transcriptional repressor/antitoxin RelB|nr:DUF6290 family protein [Glaciihabitans sp.]